MTAVIYARYSSDNQREESIEGQIRECTAYAEKNGITVVKHYIDRALSAKTDNRPDFQQMIKDSEKRLFDIVLVWKLDRFARNRYDSAHYVTILHIMSTSWSETMSSWCPLLNQFQMVQQVLWSKVCSPAWLNIIPQNFLKRSCAA